MSFVSEEENLLTLSIKTAGDLYDAIAISKMIEIITLGLSFEYLVEIPHSHTELDALTTLLQQHNLFEQIEVTYNAFRSSQLIKSALYEIDDLAVCVNEKLAQNAPFNKPPIANYIKRLIIDGHTLGNFLKKFEDLKSLSNQNLFLLALPSEGSKSFLQTIIRTPLDLYNAISISGWITILCAMHLSHEYLVTIKHNQNQIDNLSQLVEKHGFFKLIKRDFDRFRDMQLDNNTNGFDA